MKRKWPTNATPEREGDLRKNFTREQLEAIGAATIAWNEAEILLDICVGECLDMNSAMWFEVSTRINGVEGKVAIVRKALPIWDHEINPDIGDLINGTLSALLECKSYRDAVVHARAYDAPKGIGELMRRQAKREQVLLTPKALNGLYERLNIVRNELVCVTMMFTCARRVLRVHVTGEQQPEQDILKYAAQLQEHQTERRSLPPLPTFPKSPPALPKTGASPR